MKTVICDVCGKSREDLRIYFNPTIYRFKVSILEDPVEIKKFDVCQRCLSRIADEVRGVTNE